VLLREEHRLRVFEKKLFRGILRPRRVGTTGRWRKIKFYNDALLRRTLYPILLGWSTEEG
jgi:hypothetical protein